MPPADLRVSRSAIRWCFVEVDRHRQLVLGRRTGRLYLIPPSDTRFCRMVGLRKEDRVPVLADPVTRLVFERSDLAADAGPAPSLRLRLLYLVGRASRAWLPLVYAVRLLDVVARRACGVRRLSVEEIGRVVHNVERWVHIEDCYPRALLTYWLCRTSRLRCEITVGVLTPTRKMHVWCSVDGLLPYEPSRIHHAFQPLLII